MIWVLNFIRFYQLIDIIGVFLSLIPKKTNNINILKMANWVYYFLSIGSFLLCFGLAEEIKADPQEKDFGVIVIFSVAILTAICIILVQKIWYIKYDEKELIFRNSFGITKKYNINELSLVEKERMSEIYFKGKKIIEWDTAIVNIKQDIEISKFFHRQSLK